MVGDAIDAMSKIEKPPEQISKIIGVIDDSAFQTNLLALNAGVKAARVGEAVRGFAVVGSEVRALAQRSSEAASEIKQLISERNQQVSAEVKLVGKSGEEQATALAEVNLGVSQLDEVTQQNAAMAEEAAVASEVFSSDAIQVTEETPKFRDGSNVAEAHPAGKNLNFGRAKPIEQPVQESLSNA